MAKTEQLNNLFREWQEKYPCYKTRFVKDGIVHEKSWDSAARKILFLLKDTNDKYYQDLAPSRKNAYGDDIRKMLDDEPWKEIGYLTYGLQNTTKSFLPSFKDATKNVTEACRQSAVVNLKKTPGKSYANPKEILESAKQQKEEIEKEIRIICPDVIVLGGIGSIITKVFSQKQFGERIYNFSIGDQEFLTIDFVHPQARVGDDILYYALTTILQRHLFAGKT